MKKIITISILTPLFVLFGCKEDTIPTYSGDNYINFEHESLVGDSLTLTFSLYPLLDELEGPMTVKMSGLPYPRTTPYKLKVDTELTTATEGVHFTMPGNTAFEAGEYEDECYITFLRTPEMKTRRYTVVLRVDDNETFRVGDPRYAYIKFNISDMLVQPGWWKGSTVLQYYLGPYTDRKYEHFLIATGATDLPDDVAYDVIRHYAIVFKRYLEEMADAGTPVYEEDGSRMTVPVLN